MWKFFWSWSGCMTSLLRNFGSHRVGQIFCFRISWYNFEFIDPFIIVSCPGLEAVKHSPIGYWCVIVYLCRFTAADLWKFMNKNVMQERNVCWSISAPLGFRILFPALAQIIAGCQLILMSGSLSKPSSVILQNYEEQNLYMTRLINQPQLVRFSYLFRDSLNWCMQFFLLK